MEPTAKPSSSPNINELEKKRKRTKTKASPNLAGRKRMSKRDTSLTSMSESDAHTDATAHNTTSYRGTNNKYSELAAESDKAEEELQKFMATVAAKNKTQLEEAFPPLPIPSQLKEMPQKEVEPRQPQIPTQPKQKQQLQQRPHQEQQQQPQQADNTLNAKQKKKEKVPPINIFKQSPTDTIKLAKLGIGKNNFHIKRHNNIKHTINVNNMENYKKMKGILEGSQTQFYSFTPKGEKLHNILLKGVDPEADPQELLEELRGYNSEELTFVSVKHFGRSRSGAEQNRLPFFLVQLSPQSRLDGLKNIRYVNYHKIKWEKINKKDILQCMRCQRFGHAAANCQMAFRCVKCGSNHKQGECPLGNEHLKTSPSSSACFAANMAIPRTIEDAQNTAS